MEDIKAQLQGAIGDSPTPDASDVKEPDVKPGTDAGSGSGSTVSLEAFNEVLARLKDTNAQLESMRGGLAFVEKVKQVLADDSAGTQMNPRDKMVLQELHRLVPGLKYLESVPQMIQAVEKTVAENKSSAADSAWTFQQALQKEHKIAENDPEVTQMLGIQIREWINGDKTRSRRFLSGDQNVVKEGFEHVVNKLYGPERLAKKRAAVTRAASLPTVPGSRGGAGASGSEPAINFKQAPGLVRHDVRSALKAFAQGMGRDTE